jgi:hypothetical protein
MQYVVEVIGKEFNNKAVKALEANLNAKHGQGYRFHSVFEVSQPGCAGIGQPSITYIAVFEKI